MGYRPTTNYFTKQIAGWGLNLIYIMEPSVCTLHSFVCVFSACALRASGYGPNAGVPMRAKGGSAEQCEPWFKPDQKITAKMKTNTIFGEKLYYHIFNIYRDIETGITLETNAFKRGISW